MKNKTPESNAAITIAGSVPEAMLVVGADGSILLANDRFSPFFGLNPQTKHRHLSDIFSDSIDYLRQSIRDWLGTSEPLPKTFHRQNPDNGSDFIRVEGWRSVHDNKAVAVLRFFSGNPNVDHFIELTRLVDNLNKECAARARIEKELRNLLQQLNATNNMRDLVVAQMSHDFRTPLNAILGMADFMQSEPFGALEERYRGYVCDIKYSGEVLLELVDSVLAMNDDKDFTERATDILVDLADCLESCQRVVAPLAKRRGIELLVPKDLCVPRIRAEKTLVKQILMNLIGNSVKHIDKGCHVKVEVDWSKDKDLSICIIDDGPGIEPRKLERLLQFNTRSAYSIDETGFGMGLFLTKRSAEAIGGQIRIDSIPGQGTTATMSFPSTMLERSAP
ncbi:MAG: PAS domain-containing sensor histidine kinase [Alphaproteobacteria bacterium]